MNSSWDSLMQSVQADFADLPDTAGVARLILRLLIAAVLGGILGFERERAGKDAGLRTHMLVALGSALFVFIPQQAGISTADLSRVIQGVATGIGFVGAGAILKLSEERRIEGLTTAANIWLTSAVGIGAGMGREGSAILGTLLALVVLAPFHWLDRPKNRASLGVDHQAPRSK